MHLNLGFFYKFFLHIVGILHKKYMSFIQTFFNTNLVGMSLGWSGGTMIINW